MDTIIFLEPVFAERIWGGRNLEKLKIGDSVNIETDILAKYIKAQLKLFGGKFND